MKHKIFLLVSLISLLFLMVINSVVVAQDDKGKQHPQFVFPVFSSGIIVTKDGTRIEMKLNYSMVDERMITENNGVYRYLQNVDNVDTIYLQNRIFIPEGTGFYEIVANGQVPVYLQYRGMLTVQGSDVGFGMKNRSVGPTELRRYEIGYGDVVYIDLPPNTSVSTSPLLWVKKGSRIGKFTNKKQLIRIFPEYRTELTEYFKQNDLNLKVHEDIVKLGMYLNALVK